MLEELLQQVATAYPDDPVVRSLAAEESSAAGPGASRAQEGRLRAARLRERFTRVYSLEDSPPAVGAGPGVGR